MRVALINNFPPYSGTGRYPYQLWKEFKSYSPEKLKADLFCTHVMDRQEFNWPQNQGVKFLHKKAYKENEWRSRLAIYFIDPLRVPKNYDLYHITSHMLGHFVPFLKPSVVTIHDVLQFKYADQMASSLFSSVYNALLRRSLNWAARANRILTVSERSKREIIDRFEVEPSKVSVVYNGVDQSVFKPGDKNKARHETSLPQDKKIILHVGAETARKNIPVLLEALKTLVDRGQDIILVRIGEKTKEIDFLINKMRLNDRVFYYSNVPEEKLPLYYQAADVLVLPSLDEGFGFPLVEAMACGTPVVTSNHDPMVEVVGSASLTFLATDFQELTSKISSIFRDNDLCFRLVTAQLERVKEFTWEKCSAGVFDVYQEVLASV